MKLIQINAWLGSLLHPLLTFIDQEKPDIVCAQEILKSDFTNPLFDIYSTHSKLAEKFPYHFFAPTYAFQALGAKIDFGNAIYSRFPILDPKTYFINGQYHPDQLTADFVHNIRNLQICTLQLPKDKSLVIVNHQGFHDFNPEGNHHTVTAMEKVAALVQKAARPLIFSGDLNIQSSSPAMRALDGLKLRNLTNEYNLPTTLSSVHPVTNIKNVACDYIFVSEGIEVKQFAASEALVSDHKALILECNQA